MSPLQAHREAQQEWDRLRLIDEARAFAAAVRERAPAVPGDGEYQAYAADAERRLRRERGQAAERARLRLMVPWLVVLAASALVGAWAYLAARPTDAGPSDAWLGVVAVALGLGLVLAAVGFAWVIRAVPRADAIRAEADAVLARGLTAVPDAGQWRDGEYAAREEAFLAAFGPPAQQLDVRFRELGDAPLHPDEWRSAQLEYRSMIEEVRDRRASTASAGASAEPGEGALR